MPLPRLGVAICFDDLAPLRNWIFDTGRAIEIQDFVTEWEMVRDISGQIDAYRAALKGHDGPLGLHGPYWGYDIGNPDSEIRAVVQKRFLRGLEVTEALGADQMVVHSPFTYWDKLNYACYPGSREYILDCASKCLAPVLARAEGCGITLVVENIGDADPKDRGDLVRQIAHPNLRLSLDTGHADLAHGRYEAPPVIDFLKEAGDLLAHVHLQDADGYADRHWHPGEGRISWPPIFHALAAMKATPRLILEVNARKEALPATVARLEALGLAC